MLYIFNRHIDILPLNPANDVTFVSTLRLLYCIKRYRTFLLADSKLKKNAKCFFIFIYGIYWNNYQNKHFDKIIK